MPDLTPDDVARREFRSGFRGYETSEVRAFLEEVAAGLTALVQERSALASRLSLVDAKDMKSEIAAISHEVGEVLEAARQAAEAMRERAAGDATKWRSEAIAEAEAERGRAAVDAERLRTDAWTVSEQLLTQCQAQAARVVETAEKEALRLVGEAERESHRMQAAARRESEDVVRAARMEAERVSAEARARHDEMIQAAMRQSEAAQERTLALEHRRQELLRELESVRATLTQVEGELDQRRERMGLSPPEPPPAAARVVKAAPRPGPVVTPVAPTAKGDETGLWEPGETVRVVRPERPGEEPSVSQVTPQSLEPEVKILSGRQFARIKAGLDPEDEPETPEPAGAAPIEAEAQPQETDGDATVRVVLPPVAEPEVAEPEVAEPEVAEPEVAEPPVVDAEDPDVAVPAAEAERVGRLDDLPDEPVVEYEFDQVMEPDVAAEPEPAAAPPQPPPPHRPIDQPVPAPSSPARLQSAPRIVAAPQRAERPPTEEATPASAEGQDQPQLFRDVTGLFDRLRTDEVPVVGGERRTSEPVMSRRLTPSVVDPFEVRDRLLLPIGNRALRNLKRQLTEAQNEALEEIRLDESHWEPTLDSIRNRVRADLVVLFAESFGAGHSAAEEMMGGRVPRPATPRDDVAGAFVDDLVRELIQVLAEGRHSGHGARQLGASISRVFRGWRTDQAERRVRDLSLGAYHDGLVRSLELTDVTEISWKVAGRGCATCRAAGEERPPGLLPPAHAGCECTVAP